MRIQQLSWSTGSYLKCKCYFNEKHYLYSYKTKVSVSSFGPGIFVFENYPESVYDKETYRQYLTIYKCFLDRKKFEASVENKRLL